jgi:hypothetical protein
MSSHHCAQRLACRSSFPRLRALRQRSSLLRTVIFRKRDGAVKTPRENAEESAKSSLTRFVRRSRTACS